MQPTSSIGMVDLTDRNLKEFPTLIIKKEIESLALQEKQELAKLKNRVDIKEIEQIKLQDKIKKKYQLKGLNLRKNKISKVPRSISNYTALHTLWIGDGAGGNNISEFPNTITKLINLTSFNFSSNKFKKIPEFFFQLTNLTELSFDDNEIEIIPTGISKLINLNILRPGSDTGGNKISNLPDELFKLTQLTLLNLENNLLTALPSGIFSLTDLKELYLGNNQIKDAAPGISKLVQLRVLQFGNKAGGCSFKQMPAGIEKLTSLKKLAFTGNKLIQLPSNIGHLVCLKSLHLSANKIKKFPDSIGNLTNLTTLQLGSSLGGNLLTELPSSFSKLTNLTNLSFTYNRMQRIPLEIFALTQLSELWFPSNNLLEISSKINNLTNLKILSLFYNSELKQLPKEMTHLVKLQTLSIDQELAKSCQDDPQLSLFLNQIKELNVIPSTPKAAKEGEKISEKKEKNMKAKKRRHKKQGVKNSTSISFMPSSVPDPSKTAENTTIPSLSSVTQSAETAPAIHLPSLTQYEREKERIATKNSTQALTAPPLIITTTTTTTISLVDPSLLLSPEKDEEIKKREIKEEKDRPVSSQIKVETLPLRNNRTFRIIMEKQENNNQTKNENKELGEVDENKEKKKDHLRKPKELFNKITSYGHSFCNLAAKPRDMIKILSMLRQQGEIKLITKNPQNIYALKGHRKLYLDSLHEADGPEKLRAFLAPRAPNPEENSEEILQVIMDETIQSQIEEGGYVIKFSQLMTALATGEKRGKFKRLKHYSDYEGKLFSMKLSNHDRLYFEVLEWEDDNPTVIRITSAKGHR